MVAVSLSAVHEFSKSNAASVDLIAGLGASAIVEVTGLRNPCRQLDEFRPGLKEAVLDRDEDGRLLRKTGVMGVVVANGPVRPHDPVRVELPAEPHVALDRV